MTEVGERPPEVQPAQVQVEAPQKESFVKRFINRLTGGSTPTQELPTQEIQGEGLSGTRTTEQIQEQAQQIPSTPEQPQERVPAPGETGYEPLTKVSPVPELERQAQLRYAGQQMQAEKNELPATAEVAQETETDMSRPAWLRKEDQRLTEGYAQEGIGQVPQTPGTGIPTEQVPTTYESPFSTSEQAVTQQPTPQSDTAYVEKVLETPTPGEHTEVEGFLQTKPPAAEGLGQTPQAPEPSRPRIKVVETPSEEQPIPIQIPQEEKIPA